MLTAFLVVYLVIGIVYALSKMGAFLAEGNNLLVWGIIPTIIAGVISLAFVVVFWPLLMLLEGR